MSTWLHRTSVQLPAGVAKTGCTCVNLQSYTAGRCDPLNDSNYAWASGTSMACPHVAAAAAIYLEQHPDASPAMVAQAITNVSSTGLLSTDGMLPGTPNRLLFVDRAVI